MARGDRPAARHEQLSGLHGQALPRPCEAACVLGVNDDPVTIKQVELNIIEHAYEQGWVKAQPAETPTGKSVAVVGSGPAGLACAQQLARAGHAVTSSSGTTASAGFSATVSQNSRWRSGSWTAASTSWRRRA